MTHLLVEDPVPSPARLHTLGCAGAAGGALLLLLMTATSGIGSAGTHAVFVGTALVAVGVYGVMRYRGFPPCALLPAVWPVLTCAMSLLVAVIEPGAVAPFPGIVTLCFFYAGWTLPPRRSWVLLPVACTAWATAQPYADGWWWRFATAVVMWLVIAEVPAHLLAKIRQQRAQLLIAASTDALTGLLDRTTLQRELEQVPADGAIIVIDLDRFKAYNDRHGHGAGDQLLAEFADQMRRLLDDGDRAFRVGGDEFLVILKQGSTEAARRLVDGLRLGWSDRGVSFSAGVAASGGDAVTIADNLMYAAKRAER